MDKCRQGHSLSNHARAASRRDILKNVPFLLEPSAQSGSIIDVRRVFRVPKPSYHGDTRAAARSVPVYRRVIAMVHALVKKSALAASLALLAASAQNAMA